MAFAGDCPVSERNDPNITALINNAGIGSAGPLLTSDVDQMGAMIQLNVVALTRLALAAAPAFVARKNGTIVNIASIVALDPEVLNGSYSGTKAYVVNFTQALHKEFKGSGVKVQAVLPVRPRRTSGISRACRSLIFQQPS